MQPFEPNPLAKHFRQPKIYIQLPSNGEYYNGGLVKTENNEYPVLGMTAKDELMYKTPDALINGQATVNVIQSCLPNIKNAWNVPSIDLDVILIAIRIATFGEMLDVNFKVPGLDEERAYEVDLRLLLDQLYSQEFENTILIGDFTVEIAPTSYKYFTDVSIKTMEEQRIFRLLRDNKISDEEKLAQVQKSFDTLTDINIGLVKNSVVSIKYEDEPAVTNRNHINEFINNAEKDFYYAVVKHIEAQKEKFKLKPLTVEFSAEDQEKGAPARLEVPVMLDQSNFFGKGS